MKQLLLKIKEALLSVLPVTGIVIILSFTPLVNFEVKEIVVFCVSAIMLIIGIGLFNLGADLAMTPMGEQVGVGLTKSKNINLLLIVCFALGVLITIAEPDLSVLAAQVKNLVSGPVLIVCVGLGVGILILVPILKIVFNKELSSLLMFFYTLIFALTALVIVNDQSDLLPLAFDSGGVTTGPITVPFIMALGMGIAATIGGKKASENSFGFIALCSAGPIIAVLCLSIFSMKSGDVIIQTEYEIANNFFLESLKTMLSVTKEVSIALGLVVVFFFVIQFIFLKLPKKKIVQIIIGILYTYFGLIVFLTAVNIGFMPIGNIMGRQLASGPKYLIVIFGFLIGLVVVLAEPAVHVLNKQVEEITNGTVTKRAMLIALSIGVGLSIGLSMIRIIFQFSILYYLIPGYLISLGLSFFVPGLYTAIAFDSGGVASGPLTSSFILPFAIGVCSVTGGNVLSEAFGIVAMVAMTPLITIQVLGFKAVVTKMMREKIAMRRILESDDDQIIEFM